MTKNFAIYAAVVADSASRESLEDLTPTQFRSFTSDLKSGDTLVV